MKKITRRELRKIIAESSMYDEQHARQSSIYDVVKRMNYLMGKETSLTQIDYDLAVDKSPLWNIIKMLQRGDVENINDYRYFLGMIANLSSYVSNHPQAQDPLYRDNLDRINRKIAYIVDTGKNIVG